MIDFYFNFESLVITDIVQALAAVIGVIFLIINLRKTNEILNLQNIALRNSQRPVITAAFDYNYLTESQQKKEGFPVSIIVSKNPVSDLRVKLMHGLAIDFSNTETQFGEQRLYYPKMEIGERLTLRYTIKEGYLDPPIEWPDEHDMRETMKLYGIEIILQFQDDNGFNYSQKITFNPNIGHDPIVHKPEFL